MALSRNVSCEGPKALLGACMQVITCRPDQLVPANPVILDGIADLTGLTYLNEPSILHGLNLRYAEDQIYTHAGPVLIAINPFKQVRRQGHQPLQAGVGKGPIPAWSPVPATSPCLS